MTQKALIAYATVSGSTKEVAEAIVDVLSQGGASVEVKNVQGLADLSAYEAVVLGAPVIEGWHRDAVRFLEQRQSALRKVPVAYFFTALNITRTSAASVNGVPIYVDRKNAKAPQDPRKLRRLEKMGDPAHFLTPVLDKAPQVRPVSAGFFGGKLDFSTLGLLPRLFVKIVFRCAQGDYRNWEAIGAWAASLPPLLGLEATSI